MRKQIDTMHGNGRSATDKKQKATAFKVLFAVGLVLLAFSYYKVLGPMPWKDRLSREINHRLNIQLEKKENVDLSDIYQKKGEGIYFVILPPYSNLADIDCPNFPQSFLKTLTVKRSLQDDMSIFVLIDSRGIISEATINSRKFLCYDILKPACMPLDGALLQLVTRSNYVCFNLIERRQQHE